MSSTSSIPSSIILFHYPFSPYAKRVTAYLTLRRIPYAQCIQAPILPRPDVANLGISYRRIPLMSIDGDVYADTRLILAELERRFPPSSSHPGLSSESTKGMERLLEVFTTDGGVFGRAAQLIPTHLPLLNDPKFTKDRAEFTGRSWSKSDVERARPEAIAHMRRVFDIYEALLADGRSWIAGGGSGDGPTLADIEGWWPLEWLLNGLQAVKKPLFGEERYPRTYGWVKRFNGALKEAQGKAPKPVSVKGEQAAKHIVGSARVKEEGVEEHEPTGLKAGDVVKVWPIESGFNHKDSGKLIRLTKDEVVIAVTPKVGGGDGIVHLHCPRWGFRIAPASSSKL